MWHTSGRDEAHVKLLESWDALDYHSVHDLRERWRKDRTRLNDEAVSTCSLLEAPQGNYSGL